MVVSTFFRKRTLFCALVMALPALPALARNDAQNWTTLFFTNRFDETFTANLFLQGRFDDNISRTGVVLVRPEFAINLADPVQITFGYDAFRGVQEGIPNENRIWQQLGLEHDLFGLAAQHRLRTEERFIEGTQGVTLRQRYRFRLQEWVGPEENWLLFGSNEVFFNVITQEGGPREGFNQNRLQGGLGYRFTPATRIESGYQWIRGRRGFNAHVLLLTYRVQLDRLFAED